MSVRFPHCWAHLFTAAVDALERQARQHTAGMAELARTIRVLLGASTAGLLKPEDDHFIRGLVEAYRMLLGLPDTKAAAVEAASTPGPGPRHSSR